MKATNLTSFTDTFPAFVVFIYIKLINFIQLQLHSDNYCLFHKNIT